MASDIEHGNIKLNLFAYLVNKYCMGVSRLKSCVKSSSSVGQLVRLA